MSHADLRVLAEDAIDNIDYPGSDSPLWESKAKEYVTALADALEAAEAELTRRDTVIDGVRDLWDREINSGFQFLYRQSLVPELRSILSAIPDTRDTEDDWEPAVPVSLEAADTENES